MNQQIFFEEDNDHLMDISPFQSDDQASQTVVKFSSNKKTIPKVNEKNQIPKKANSKLPKNFVKNRKQLIQFIQDYFNTIKQEYLELLEKKDSNKQLYFQIQFRDQYLMQIKRLIKSYLVIKRNQNSKINITMPDSAQPIFMFCPQHNMIISYDGNNSDKKLYKKKQYIPDIATPVYYQNFIYLVDGAHFQQQKNIFIPSKFPIKINLQTGQSQELSTGKFQRIKCATIKFQNYIYTLGGFVSEKKLKTNTCERFNLKTEKWQTICNLSKAYACCSACIFNDSLYIFDKQKIQKLIQSQNLKWIPIFKPKSFIFYAFSFFQQISKQQILIMGGCQQNKRIDQMQILNINQMYCQKLQFVLPTCITNERVSQCLILKNRIFSLSPVFGQIFPQMGVKKGMIQIIITGGMFNYLKTIIINQNKN